MTATARIFRVAVAVTLGLTAPLALRAEASEGARVGPVSIPARPPAAESATLGPARHGRQPAIVDTAAKRERGKSERSPATPKRRVPRAKSGASTAPQPSAGASQYVPDQPWDTEFFVRNTLPTRHYVVRLASVAGD